MTPRPRPRQKKRPTKQPMRRRWRRLAGKWLYPTSVEPGSMLGGCVGVKIVTPPKKMGGFPLVSQAKPQKGTLETKHPCLGLKGSWEHFSFDLSKHFNSMGHDGKWFPANRVPRVAVMGMIHGMDFGSLGKQAQVRSEEIHVKKDSGYREGTPFCTAEARARRKQAEEAWHQEMKNIQAG